jgi:magnesium transporter
MSEQDRQSLLAPEIRELLQEGRIAELSEVLADMHPLDAAGHVAGLATEDINNLMSQVDVRLAKDLFSYLPPDVQEAIVLGSGKAQMTALLSALSSDDRAAFMDQLDERVRDQVWPLLSKVAREDLGRREHFEDDRVGAIMTTEYCALDPTLRVTEAIESVRRQAPDRETIYYCYVVDKDGRLIGTLSLRDLILARAHQTIGDVMTTDLVAVGINADQEEAARLIQQYDLLALPVIDSSGRLVGLVTHDDAADIVQEEETENVERMAGITGESEGVPYLEESVFVQIRRRSPLIVFLALFYIITAQVIGSFESALQGGALVIPTMMPMVMATGGMVGSQASSLIIRAIALGNVAPAALPRVLWKELRISIGVGLLLSAVGFAEATWLHREPTPTGLEVAAAVALALTVYASCAALLGAAVPLIAKAAGRDPALVSTPLVTAVADLVGASIYLLCVTALLF